jgi:hypothetical protein
MIPARGRIRRMSTESYLRQICLTTENEAKGALCIFLAKQYSDNDEIEEGQATLLAVAVTNKVFGEPPTGQNGIDFADQNIELIESHAQQLHKDDNLCVFLTMAAYNTCYGRYLAAGGSRGMFSNKFLKFIRCFSRMADYQYVEIASKAEREIELMSPAILRPIQAMRSLQLFQALPDNPNERAYYDAVHQFGASVGAFSS